MRINISVLVLAAGLTSSASSEAPPLPDQNNTGLSLQEQNRLALELLPPTCNLNACLGLTGTISCVVSALGSGDTKALQKCLICSCAACVPAVTTFLNSLGICVSSPGGGSTTTSFFTSFKTEAAPTQQSGIPQTDATITSQPTGEDF
ncbi:hypothetical protein N7462_002678 [Penicillium macrosclerotiorum]|uniref:uncharacterized protein n=1 Tax=Penicillium macrosclerotiorum TaxID=303699 RepID=UPI002548EA4A|nr:uncharacterized protein N7462_002678 [Penicillium macrosclerotiorum]KAJ5693255.1 hypothetical protein N7462_002678 [Penicillium macrosclerotiorum]